MEKFKINYEKNALEENLLLFNAKQVCFVYKTMLCYNNFKELEYYGFCDS